MPRPVRSVTRTVLALVSLLAASSAATLATADPWPASGVKVMSTNGSVYTLPGPPGQIRVVAQSPLCAPAGSAGYAAGVLDTSGNVLAGNGSESLLFCYPPDGTNLSLGPPIADPSGQVYAVLNRSSTTCFVHSIMGSSSQPGGASLSPGGAPSCYVPRLVPRDASSIFAIWHTPGELDVQAFGPSGADGPMVQTILQPDDGTTVDGPGPGATNGRGPVVISVNNSHIHYLDSNATLHCHATDGHLLWSRPISGAAVADIVPDSTGGTFVLLAIDPQIGDDYFVTRVDGGGGLYPGWSTYGMQIGSFRPFPLVPDGLGGLLYFTKISGSYFVRRLLPTGSIAAGWSASIASSVTSLQLCADGFGGAVAAWSPSNPGTGADAYAMRVFADGSHSNPIPLAAVAGDQLVTSIRSDLAGNVYPCWTDTRDGTQQAYVGHLTVRPFNSQLAFTAAANPCLVAQPVALTVTVRPEATGTVDFFAAGAPIGTVAVVDGVASLSYVPQQVGVRTLMARYSGDALYEPASDSIAVSVLDHLPTTVTITFAQTPGTSTGTLTANVTPADATGNFTFTVPGVDPVTLPVAGGSASLVVHTPVSGTGAAPVTVAYSGDSVHLPSSAQQPLVFATLTTIDAFATDVYAGSLLRFASTIAPPPTGGSVAFAVDDDPLYGYVPAAGGFAQTAPDSLPVGAHHVLASFTGAPFFGSSGSGELDVNVLPIPAAYLRVLAPNNGEVWSIGTSHTIRWDASSNPDPPTVSLYVWRGSSWKSIALGVPNTGTYGWTVNGPVAIERALIRVTDPSGVGVEDESDLPFTIGAAVGAVGDATPREMFATAYPNPSPGPTSVRFALPHAARVRLTVIDLQGREVATLAEGDYAAGRYDAAWDGRGRSGAVPAGLYFVRLSAGEHALVTRVAIVSAR